MNLTSLNWVAILLGALTIFVINAIWFGPKTFYPVWWKALGKEVPGPEDRDNSGKTMLRLFGGSFAAALAQSVVLTFAISVAAQDSHFAVVTGGVYGLAFGVIAAGASLAHRLFGQQGFKVWIIEVGADVVALIAAGLVIAALV